MARRPSLALLTTTRRGRAIVAGSLLLAGAGLVVGPTGAVAAPTLPPTHVAITSIVNTMPDAVTVPATPGAPAALLRADDTFDLTVTLLDDKNRPAVVSNGQDTVVTLTLDTPAQFGGVNQAPTVTVPAKASSGTVRGLSLRATASDIKMTATVTGGTTAALALAAGTAGPFNLVNKFVGVPITNKGEALTVSTAGVNNHCVVDDPALVSGSVQTCVELVAPRGVSSDAVFSTGECRSTTDCASSGDLLQVLADLSGRGYDNKHPATVIINCDKSLCGNSGVPSLTVQASLNGGGPLSAAPGCKKKGVIDAGLDLCVDYVQSTRDNAGDVHLYLLIARDARTICC
jgi:hypothetical protein